jgi:hypothetical protein
MIWLRNGLIYYNDTKTKCRLYWCLIEFIDWRYSQSCRYFRPSFANCWPSNILSGSPPTPLPPSQSQNKVYRDGVCLGGGGGGGVELSWRPYSAGIWHSVSDQIQNLQNCYTNPKQKPRRGEGLKQIYTCRKVPLQVNFFLITTFGIDFYQSNPSLG